MEKHTITVENAPKFLEWVTKRGGILVWESINFSNPGASWSTPYIDANGNRVTKPNWQCSNEPSRHITDPSEILVVTQKEVKRFRVAVRRTGPFGMTFKVSDGGTRRIHRECAKAEKKYGNSSYHFDYETQEAVITIDDIAIPLNEWEASLYETSHPDPSNP